MRLPESRIKAAILHPEEECRIAAASFFSGAFSRDEAVMPLVIQAVGTYGRPAAFRLLRSAQNLPQTPDSVDWLLAELGRDFDPQNPDDDDYRLVIALILYRAGPDVLLGRRAEIAAARAFPQPLRAELDERFHMLGWDWDRGWQALEGLGPSTTRRGGLSSSEARHAERIIESLARHRATRGASVLELLGPARKAADRPLAEWLRPWIVNLSGAMRIEPAVPFLVETLSDENLEMADESTTALIKIGSDAAVRAIADKWPGADASFRAAAADVLEYIHTDLSAQCCLSFFSVEEDAQTKLSLAHAVLSQLCEEGVEPVRQFVLAPGPSATANHLDIRYRLVVACEIMGATFPEFGAWREDAVASRWGLGDYKPRGLP